MMQSDDSTSGEQRVWTDDSGEPPRARTDGGVESHNGSGKPRDDAPEVHRNTDYLDAEVNILRPSTPFMRDHLRLIWVGFLAWTLVIFGPVTATYVAQDAMTGTTFIGFPLHYFLVAIGGPGGALILSIIYSWRRDKLDEKYGIDHSHSLQAEQASETEDSATATDGGVDVATQTTSTENVGVPTQMMSTENVGVATQTTSTDGADVPAQTTSTDGVDESDQQPRDGVSDR